MPKTFIESPATPSGTNAEKLEEMYRYLTRMSEQLNEAMNTITAEQTSGGAVTVTKTTGASPVSGGASDTAYNSLKSMIVKTARIVRSEMDQISTELHADYEAISDEFGELVSNLDTTIKATAEGVLAQFNSTQRVTERLSANEEELANYMRKISQYLFMGYIDADHIGIAIGNNVTEKDAQGNDVLNNQNKMATFTMGELAFYVGGAKVAWFSQSTFSISAGKITNTLKIGNNHEWRVVGTGNIALCAT